MAPACAVGLSLHTGWAAACVVTARPLRVLLRERLVLLGDPERFVFHRAAELAPGEAARSVARARKLADAGALAALGKLLEAAREAGLQPRRVAVVARHGELPPLAEILVAHPRIHTGEGWFFRDVLLGAAQAHGLAAHVYPPRELEALAAKALALRSAALASELSRLGKELGPPWGKDQRLAALAAWAALAS